MSQEPGASKVLDGIQNVEHRIRAAIGRLYYCSYDPECLEGIFDFN